MELPFYVYRHIRTDKNEPFYVGMGCKRTKKSPYYRANSWKNRNKHWLNIAKKTKFDVEILFESADFEEIKRKEIEFISLYGRADLGKGPLCNFTDGGEGVLGFIFSEEQKAHLKEKRKNQAPLSAEARKRISLANMGNTNLLGKACSPETAQLISKGNKCKVRTPEMKEKYSKAKLGKRMSEETKQKIRDKLTGMKYNKNKNI